MIIACVWQYITKCSLMRGPRGELMAPKTLRGKVIRYCLIAVCALIAGRFLQIVLLTAIIVPKIGDDVANYSIAGPLFRLGDYYASFYLYRPAGTYYDLALRTQPRNMERQVKYAENLFDQQRYFEAYERVSAVRDSAAQDTVRQKALRLIDRIKDRYPERLVAPDLSWPQTAANIVLVPVGSMPAEVIEQMVPRLQDIMHCRFSVADAALPIGPPDRDATIKFLSQETKGVALRLSFEDNLKMLTENGLTNELLRTRSGMEKYIVTALKSYPEKFKQGSAGFFKSNLKVLDVFSQYDASLIINKLHDFKALPRSEDIQGYVGVACRDLYSDDLNFLYAMADGQYAILSCARYGSLEDLAGRTLLTERMFKQTVTSAMFALEIPRCSAFYCIRAFSDALSDVDKKGDILCMDCQKKLCQRLSKPRAS